MQQLATEVSLLETAFAHPLGADAETGWDLRWFTLLEIPVRARHVALHDEWDGGCG